MIFRKAKIRDYTGLRNLRERSHEILLKLSVAAGIPQQNPFYKHEVSTSKKNQKKGHVWTCTYRVPDFVYRALDEPRLSHTGDNSVVVGIGNDLDSDYALSLSALEVMYYLERHRLRPAREQAFIRYRAEIPLGTRLCDDKRYELTYQVRDDFMKDSILAKLVLKIDREQAAKAAAAATSTHAKK